MTLKDCPCCHKIQTTKNVVKIGRDDVAIFFNCMSCYSTFIIRSKDWHKKIIEARTVRELFKKGAA